METKLPRPTYKYEELKQRVELMAESEIMFSNQYGMLFILNKKGEILLNITGLLNDERT